MVSDLFEFWLLFSDKGDWAVPRRQRASVTEGSGSVVLEKKKKILVMVVP